METYTSTGYQHQTHNAHSCLDEGWEREGEEEREGEKIEQGVGGENTTNIQNMIKIEGNAHGSVQ